MNIEILKPLIDYFKKSGCYTNKYIEKIYLTDEVKAQLKLLGLDIKQLFYRVKHDIPLDKVIKCQHCGKVTSYQHGKGYTKHCSYSCATIAGNKYNKLKNTIQNKYGVSNISKLEKIKQLKKQTCIEHFGVDNYTKTQAYRDTVNKKLLIKKEKEYITKKQNHTFNSSKSEREAEKLLKQKFTKVISQYKSDKYPFACDFYIPDKDLYIECHFSQYHNKKPFDKNNVDHLKELKVFKQKAEEVNFKGKKKKQYNNIIYTWTDLDVRKLEMFKKNKLNYKIFYTLDEFKNWFNIITK